MKTSKPLLALLTATTLVVVGCSSSSNDEPDPPAPNAAPQISAITDKSGDQDTALGPFEFSVQDDSTPANQLTVTAMADGSSLLPPDGVVLGGDGAVRSVTLTPLEAATGTTTVTITVKDSQGATALRTFAVNVNARPASIRDWALTTFAKGESDDATPMNGFTFAQDADDPAIFEPLIGEE